MKTAWIIFAAAVLSFGQTTAKKEPAQAPKKTAAPAAPDTWERSKECAAQAEKLVAEWDRDGLAKGFPKTIWVNHYSPKYNKCFIETFNPPAGAPSGRKDSLFDAFERSEVASWDEGYDCFIDDEKIADCTKVRDFIREHMRN
jgi:hypothetical protein